MLNALYGQGTCQVDVMKECAEGKPKELGDSLPSQDLFESLLRSPKASHGPKHIYSTVNNTNDAGGSKNFSKIRF